MRIELNCLHSMTTVSKSDSLVALAPQPPPPPRLNLSRQRQLKCSCAHPPAPRCASPPAPRCAPPRCWRCYSLFCPLPTPAPLKSTWVLVVAPLSPRAWRQFTNARPPGAAQIFTRAFAPRVITSWRWTLRAGQAATRRRRTPTPTTPPTASSCRRRRHSLAAPSRISTGTSRACVCGYGARGPRAASCTPTRTLTRRRLASLATPTHPAYARAAAQMRAL